MAELHEVTQRDPDNQQRRGKFDAYHAAPVVVGTCESHLHNGHSYEAQAYQPNLILNGTLTVCFKTPATQPLIHFRSSFGTSAGGRMTLYEGAAWNAETGFQVPVLARNRADIKSSQMLSDILPGGFGQANALSGDPTGIVLGGLSVTTVYAFGQNKVPATERALEYVLKPDTTYALELLATTAGKGQLVLEWSEHTSE